MFSEIILQCIGHGRQTRRLSCLGLQEVPEASSSFGEEVGGVRGPALRPGQSPGCWEGVAVSGIRDRGEKAGVGHESFGDFLKFGMGSMGTWH